MSASVSLFGSSVSLRVKANAARSAGVNSDQSPSSAAIVSSFTPSPESLTSWWPEQYVQLFAREVIQKNMVLNVLFKVMVGVGLAQESASRAPRRGDTILRIRPLLMMPSSAPALPLPWRRRYLLRVGGGKWEPGCDCFERSSCSLSSGRVAATGAGRVGRRRVGSLG